MAVSVIAHYGKIKVFAVSLQSRVFCNYEIIVRSVLLTMDHLLSGSRVARREASLYIISDQPTERRSFFEG